MYQRISLTAEPLWFSFKELLLKGHGFITILVGGTKSIQRKIGPRKKITQQQIFEQRSKKETAVKNSQFCCNVFE